MATQTVTCFPVMTAILNDVDFKIELHERRSRYIDGEEIHGIAEADMTFFITQPCCLIHTIHQTLWCTTVQSGIRAFCRDDCDKLGAEQRDTTLPV